MNNLIRRQLSDDATGAGSKHQENGPPAKLVHHVFFWLKNAGDESDRQQLIAGVQTLGAIPEIKQIFVGQPADTEARGVVDASYDVSELLFFDNIEDQSIYQSHAIHQTFIENYGHLWSKVVVYDMLVV